MLSGEQRNFKQTQGENRNVAVFSKYFFLEGPYNNLVLVLLY